jgi:hypothetical protein
MNGICQEKNMPFSPTSHRFFQFGQTEQLFFDKNFSLDKKTMHVLNVEQWYFGTSQEGSSITLPQFGSNKNTCEHKGIRPQNPSPHAGFTGMLTAERVLNF